MEKTELKIDGMHCGACVRRVTALLSGVDGVKVEHVEVGKAVVSGDAPVSALVSAVESGGFTVVR
ncbi:heavy-metal-associated domain-containing protein [Bryobacter aggregatus]|uniref:heavy-metal-associated domain-containing protein n=1 Tax=Bryobacter aggregatus TaxID=360054 RepID=UPI0004E2726D|nr:heavy-metal-associated domain-containing protein [Bryobacter aggregatus]